MRKSKHFAKEELRSYNVSSIQVDKALVVIKDRFVSDVTLKNRRPLSPEEITKLLVLCLKCTYFFSFKIRTTSKFMVQPSVSPIVCNLLWRILRDGRWNLQRTRHAGGNGTQMTHTHTCVHTQTRTHTHTHTHTHAHTHQHTHTHTHRHSHTHRHTHAHTHTHTHTHTVLVKTRAQEFTDRLNSIDDDIKWTTEGEVTTHPVSNEEVNISTGTKRALDFLDTWSVINDNGLIKIKVYCKETQTVVQALNINGYQ